MWLLVLMRLLLLLRFTGIPRLVMRLMLDRRVPLGLKLVLPAALLYIASPIDLIPDMITPVGRIDDILALLVAVGIFLGLAPPHVVSEHLDAAKRSARGGRRGANADVPVIEGKYRIVDGKDEKDRPT